MKIGLIDADGKSFPNLCLMKISSYHKSRGDSVEWINYWDSYGKVYISKVFTFSKEERECIQCDDITRGGSGYDLVNKLPAEIESSFPDYSLYPQFDYALGFITRGCSRGCPFCIVNEKEGSAHQVACITDFWNGQKEIKLLDPNILEVKNRIELLKSLADTKSYIDFTQGIDVRLVDEEVLRAVKDIKIRRVHIAYDRMENSSVIEKNMMLLKTDKRFDRRRMSVYVLVNYETSIEEDLYRVSFVKSCGFQPYVMIYDKHLLPKNSFYFQFQRYVNSPRIFWKASLSEYLKSYKMYHKGYFDSLMVLHGEKIVELIESHK